MVKERHKPKPKTNKRSTGYVQSPPGTLGRRPTFLGDSAQSGTRRHRRELQVQDTRRVGPRACIPEPRLSRKTCGPPQKGYGSGGSMKGSFQGLRGRVSPDPVWRAQGVLDYELGGSGAACCFWVLRGREHRVGIQSHVPALRRRQGSWDRWTG